MQTALPGGTGDISTGLALRFGLDTDHGYVIGSRDAERAKTAAREYDRQLRERGVSADTSGQRTARPQ